MAIREMGSVTLLEALEYLAMLAKIRPDRFRRTAVRWDRRLELEAPLLTLPEAQLALAALGSVRASES